MDFVEQLKSSVDIVKVVGEYVRLKRAGAGPRYTGLCPFHTEKTASFSVHQTHQFYKCFGCGAGGDVIKFVMEIERLIEKLSEYAEKNEIAGAARLKEQAKGFRESLAKSKALEEQLRARKSELEEIRKR